MGRNQGAGWEEVLGREETVFQRAEGLLQEMCEQRKDAKSRFRCFGYQSLAKRHRLKHRSFSGTSPNL